MEYLVLLRNLGFTEYEARVYLALSRLGVATAREITWDSKLPKNKVYEMLGRLERDNKIVTLPVSPRKYKIVDPNKLKEVVDQKKETINDIGTQLDRFLKFVSLPQRNEFKEFFWVIKGQDAIIDRIAEETRKIQRESFGVMRHLRAPPKTIRLSREAIERGAKIKLISLWDSSIVDAVRKWEAIGAEVRVYDEKKMGFVGTRFSIFDKKSCRITIGKPEVKNKEDYITLWAESPSFANMLRNQFLSMWKDAKPISFFLKNYPK